jgi:hypothetical protein
VERRTVLTFAAMVIATLVVAGIVAGLIMS